MQTELAALLRDLQAREGLTGNQIAFASRLGITQPHLSRLLRGERNVGVKLAFRLLDLYPHLYEPLKRARVPSNMQNVIERRDASEAQGGKKRRGDQAR